ncbi:MAG TPA: hypothetical protein VGM05_02265 [Planctomycetaceae bacterium]|jgi:hypothetical protein
MNGISRKIRLAGCALLVVGCRNTQFPSLAPSQTSARAVNQSFAYHDPSPDIDAGPWVERPRGFERARAAPRRVDEKYNLTMQGEEGAPASSNPSASNYPSSVNP